MKKPIIAFLYDFDLTLSKKDQQEFTFIPSLGMKPAEFWQLTDKCSKENHMDRILAYLYQMMTQAKKKGTPITKEYLRSLGSTVQLLPGVEGWFERINEYGKNHNVIIKHYIISSGLTEIMKGTSIAKYFDAIYGCEFHYNENGEADFPSQLINYTTKTQYLFRISKGALDLGDEGLINSYVEDEARFVPYSNMIYLGDGLTDVPCMKLVRERGGTAVALYSKGARPKAFKLLKDRRVDFACPANYSEGSDLDTMIKKVIDKIRIEEDLKNKFNEQLKNAKKDDNAKAGK